MAKILEEVILFLFFNQCSLFISLQRKKILQGCCGLGLGDGVILCITGQLLQWTRSWAQSSSDCFHPWL